MANSLVISLAFHGNTREHYKSLSKVATLIKAKTNLSEIQIFKRGKS